MIKKLLPLIGFVLITIIFFWQFFLKGLIPVPSDTVVGLYYPYRDIYSENYPNGIPFKNFLITDPVRQQFLWKELSIDSYRELKLPTWNQYSFSGTPNLANFQSAVFYPFNLILFINPFEYSWSFLIFIQPLLASVFLYFYLRNLKLDEYSSFFGGVAFAFSGLFVTWLEWGTILHTALWLPLILLSIDKILIYLRTKSKFSINKFKISKSFTWNLVFIISLTFSFFAGHLQTFFYLILFSLVYLILRVWQSKDRIKFLHFALLIFLTAIITLPQSLPSIKFIFLSGRGLDQSHWQQEGWFLPWQHLTQFLVPDFFGNPTTLNYWGVWNYGELTGFIGIVAIIFSIFAIIFRRDKKTLLLFSAIILSLIFILPNPLSKLPFTLNLPFISTAQPTRLLFIIDFSLSILAALGLNYFIAHGNLKRIIVPIIIVGIGFLAIFSLTQLGSISTDINNLSVAKRNILFPGAIFLLASILIFIYIFIEKKYKNFLVLFLIALCIAELFRFSWKFNTFSKTEYLYPEGKVVKFLRENTADHRIATADPRILAPNFSIIHRLSSVEGYDPLYLNRYAELVAAVNRGEPNINPPFGFNRIIRIENFSSDLVDLLGVKYVLSLTEMKIDGFEEVLSDGNTRVYENKEVLPRTFFVREIKSAQDKYSAINLMFDSEFDPRNEAVIEENLKLNLSQGRAKIIKYSQDEIIIRTSNDSWGFLVLTDSFYPTWRVRINGQEDRIYITDYNFRGVVVPKGENEIVFKNSLL